ncbi:MAG: response regulator transcription factor [Methanosarcinaceae archaeon]|nr:response regulator transcription factor [Methanosarcinaceae archaeon]
MQKIKTLIVDDNTAFRKLLRNFLSSEPDLEIVGEAADGETALNQAKKLLPDLVLMDVSMKKVDGIEATRRIKKVMPELKVIMLSIYDLEEYKQAARDIGSSDYILKKNMIKELVPAIHAVFSRQDDGNLPKKTPDDKG